MSTASQALAAIRTRVEAGSLGITLYWAGDDPPILPDTPATFAYIVYNNNGSRLVSFGGGAGANRYRNRGTLEAYVFFPSTGTSGMGPVMDKAELIAAQLRSFRDDTTTVSCYSADVIPVGPGANIAPPGFTSEVNNYLCAIAEVEVEFDQIG